MKTCELLEQETNPTINQLIERFLEQFKVELVKLRMETSLDPNNSESKLKRDAFVTNYLLHAYHQLEDISKLPEKRAEVEVRKLVREWRSSRKKHSYPGLFAQKRTRQTSL